MSLADILFTITIRPLELLFEFIFGLTDYVIESPAITLVVMSLVINLIVLPLYRRADVIQQEAGDKEKKLRPMADHIRKTFKGDERIMMLQTFYKQQGYSQLSSMKSLISLLLQIPFFIAAYRFLSHLSLIKGVSMGPIKDLALPDGLIVIGGITINLLPVAMTVINIISSEIYMHGQPFKSKIVLYVSALIFLVLLYDSPSGLVFYWTFNNVFSLVKNVMYKFKNPGLVFKAVLAVTGIAGAFWLGIAHKEFETSVLILLLGILYVLEMPMLWHFISGIIRKRKKAKGKDKEKAKTAKTAKKTAGSGIMFLFTGLFMTFLLGLLIPSQVISYSPGDFIYITELNDPSIYVYNTLCLAAGVFTLWLGIFFLLASDKGRVIFARIYLAVAAVAAVDYLFFNISMGTMSAELVYDKTFAVSLKPKIINLAIVSAVFIAVMLLHRFLPRLMRYVAVVAAIAALTMGVINMFNIAGAYKVYAEKIKVMDHPRITLTRNGRNVLVLMLDRAIGSYVPYIFEEKPELVSQFDGFTDYPNTVSFGGHTNFGAPALFGGYEYTPANMNKRSDKLLMEKHNEALLLMPKLFGGNGFHVTVMDPPYANYSEITDVSIFKDLDYVSAYAVEGVDNLYSREIHIQSEISRKHNFFFYSIFKSAPVFLQQYFYANGNYCSLHVNYHSQDDQIFSYPQEADGLSRSTGMRAAFLNSYEMLNSMTDMTEIVDSDQDQFFYMDNEICHYPCLLQEPDFVPSNKVDNTEYDAQHSLRVWNNMVLKTDEYDKISHYQVNVAAYLCLGKWFDYLRSEGVWDNTRIIIVADHGFCVNNFEELLYRDLGIDAEYVNPVLMVKDFNSKGFRIEENEFMTNADVPTIAMQGVIDDPVNPFTGKPVNNNAKYTEPVSVIYSEKWNAADNNGTQFLPGHWFTVRDNIYDRSNWEFIGVR